ncbi:MAG: hypothetical protein AB2598_19590 [Candidatus Thiodiazotropha sp.]
MNIRDFPKIERRQTPQRLIWVAPETHCISPNSLIVAERRFDRDAVVVMREIERSVIKHRTLGMLFGLIKNSGRVEYGMTGMFYDSPLLATGVASRIQALTDSWTQHPMLYLPGSGDQETDLA